MPITVPSGKVWHLNTGHALYSNLRAAFVFDNANGQGLRNLVTGTDATNTGMTFSTNASGPCIVSDAAGDKLSIAGGEWGGLDSNGGTLSAVFLGLSAAGNTSGRRVFQYGPAALDGTTGGAFWANYLVSSDDCAYIGIGGTASFISAASSGTDFWKQDTTHCYGMSYDNSAAYRSHSDGAFVASTAVATARRTDGADKSLTLFQRSNNTADREWSSSGNILLIWNRNLSDADQTAVYNTLAALGTDSSALLYYTETYAEAPGGTGTSTGSGSGGNASTAEPGNGSADGGTGTSTGSGSGGTATGLSSTTTLLSPADRGNIKLSTSNVTNATTLTPNLRCDVRTMVNEYNGDPAAKQYFFYGATSGVSGKTPTFQVKHFTSSTHNSSTEIFVFLGSNPWTPGTYKPVWSYDGLTWNYYDNCAWDADGMHLNFSNNAPFASDTVYFATAFPWQEGRTATWLAGLSSPYLSEPASVIAYSGDPYQFGVTSTRTNEIGETIAACKLYAFKISSPGLAPDGNAKRNFIMVSGIHAGEDLNNWSLKGAVEFLLTDDPKAQTWRNWFNLYVYPMVLPSGRRGGHWRSDFDPGLLTADGNRYWATNTLASINAHKTAIQADTGNSFVGLFDFHAGHLGAAYNNKHTNQFNTPWLNAISVYRPGIVVNVNDVPGSTATWAVANMGAMLGITPEYNWGYTNTTAHAEQFGIDCVKAMSDLAAAGTFGVLAAGGTGTSFGSGSGGQGTADIFLAASAMWARLQKFLGRR